ncbi:hypothetical protein ACROYT_G020141 [Oculina patagonica]
MEKIHYTVISSVLVIIFSIKVRGNNGKTIQHGGSNYTLHEAYTRTSWRESRQYCKETGSDLVSIESTEEWFFVKNTILTLETEEYFIGLKKDDKAGEWSWISRTKNVDRDALHWAKCELSDDGNCAVMYKDYEQEYGKYNDLSCTSRARRRGCICESRAKINEKDGMIYKLHMFV